MTQIKAPSIFLKPLPVLAFVFALAVSACQLDHPSISTPTVSPQPGVLEVPIHARGASHLGSLEFELVYEPSQLEVVGVERASLSRNALIDFSTNTPGRTWTGIVDANGISGEGPVAIVSFRPSGAPAGSVSVALESVLAYNANTLLDVPVEPSSGGVNIPGGRVTPPVLVFAQAQ